MTPSVRPENEDATKPSGVSDGQPFGGPFLSVKGRNKSVERLTKKERKPLGSIPWVTDYPFGKGRHQMIKADEPEWKTRGPNAGVRMRGKKKIPEQGIWEDVHRESRKGGGKLTPNTKVLRLTFGFDLPGKRAKGLEEKERSGGPRGG